MAEPVSAHSLGEPATVRVAMWSSRHRWPVAAGWFLGTIGLFVLSLALGGIRADDPNGNPNQVQTESAKAYAVFDAGGSATPSEDVTIVVTHPTLHVTDPAFRAFVSGAVQQLDRPDRDRGGGDRARLRPGPGPDDGTAPGGPGGARRDGRSDRRPDQRRPGDGRRATWCRCARPSRPSRRTPAASSSTPSARR